MKPKSMYLARLPLSFTASLGLALAALGGTPVAAAQQADARVIQLLHATRFDRAAAERLYADALLQGKVDALEHQLDAVAAGSDPVAVRTAALLARATIAWQRGDAKTALAASNRAVTLSPSIDSRKLRAELLDAMGEEAAARVAYAEAAEASTAPDERARFRLRGALLAERQDPAALLPLAHSQTANGVAVAIALLGDPRDAVALYRPATTGEGGLIDALRLAEWSIAATDPIAARDQAWRAYRLATKPADRRYALALLIESFRNAADMPGALAFLEPHAQEPEVAQVRIDILLELQRYDVALAAVAKASDPAMRERMLGILDLAGRAREGEPEYRRLIAADPHRPEGYAALSILLLSEGKRDATIAVYRDFFAANAGRADLLVPAARQMIAMGLGEPAMALMQAASTAPGMAVPYRFFCVEVDRAQGHDADALAQLAALRDIIPAAAAERVAIADAYDGMGHKEEALAVLRALEAANPALDYDQRVHIAALAGEAGHGEEALSRWHRLWREAKLPARKAYLAKQIVRTAQSLGTLASLATELDRSLATRNAGEDELALLVELRIALNDRTAAIAAVEREARTNGTAEVTKLGRLIGIYARLGDHDRVTQTLRQLIQVDPKNADLYLRQLTLNAVRFAPDGEAPTEKRTRVAALLRELDGSFAASNPQTTRFAAAVYASAGLSEDALQAYRRAAALEPENLEAVTQLAELMRKQGQQTEAVTMLQHAAERARDLPSFVTAIDALMAVLSANPDGTASSPGLARLTASRLRWAERRILERIATTGEDARLYALLADLGQAAADFPLQLRAYTNSLAGAGDQRAAVLRVLVTLASGGNPNSGNAGPAVGDVQAKLAFGRRLLALKRDYPPDLYTNLAKSLLAVNDVAGAERAFGMMRDTGGLIDVDRLRGETYAAAGYVDQALLNYDRALLRDRSDPDLAVKTSILREQRGDNAAAFDWYRRITEALALRQPLRGAGGEDAALDARQYVGTLTEGLKMTWPAQSGADDDVVARFDTLLREASAGIEAGEGVSLSSYARLRFLVDLGRSIADQRYDRPLADRIDAAIAPLLPRDADARRARDLFRDVEGWHPSPLDDPDWVAHGLARQAADFDNIELAQSIALASRDPEAIRARAAEAMAIEAESLAAAQRGQAGSSMTSPLYSLLLKAVDALPPESFRTLLLDPLDKAPYRDTLLFDIYRSGSGWYDRMEKAAGRPLLRDEQLLKLVAERQGPLPYTRASFTSRHDVSASPGGIVARFSTAQKLSLYEDLVARMRQQGRETAYQEALVAQLLAARLDAGQRGRLAAAMRADVMFERQLGDRTTPFIVQKLLVLDTARENQSVLLELAADTAARYADARHLPAFLKAFFAGDSATAYTELVALQEDTAARYPALDYSTDIIRQRFATDERRAIDAFLARDRASPTEAMLFYRRFVITTQSSGTKAERAAIPNYYRKLAELEPDNPTYVSGALDALWTAGDRAGFTNMLTRYVSAHGDDQDAASTLQIADRLLGRDETASALAETSHVDVKNDDWLLQMVNRANAPTPGAFEFSFSVLFGRLYPDYAARFSNDPAVAEIEGRRRLAERQQGGPSSASPLAEVYEAAGKSPGSVRARLRALWRGTAPRQNDDGASLASRQQLLDALPDPAHPLPEQAPLLAFLRTPSGTLELEAWRAALDPTMRSYARRLNALILDGLVHQGVAPTRIAAGLASLMDGTLRADALDILAELMVRSETRLTAEQAHALTKRLAATPILTADARTRFADLYAKSGDIQAAGKLLEAALLQLIYPADADALYGGDVGEKFTALLATLHRWPDPAVSQAAEKNLRARLRRELGEAADEPPFGAVATAEAP